jgi:predicted phosphodiesterase
MSHLFAHTAAPRHADSAGIISWVHIGDLHMTKAGEQNHRDLLSIVREINEAFADSIAFVYLPGDVADDGSAAAYAAVREALDQLKAPWHSILGDHDVHEKSFANYLAAMSPERHYAFSVGSVRFLALNAFDDPDPRSFALLPDQLDWVEKQIREAETSQQSAVLLLHCYPTDLKQGAVRLQELVQSPAVRLIDMGHTHYNEVANDGQTLYTATRSTGQIEEGPVGFSITNIDGTVISWKFVELDDLPIVMITLPSDERFLTDPALPGHTQDQEILIRAKAWGKVPIRRVVASFEGRSVELFPIAGSRAWQGSIVRGGKPDDSYALTVVAEDASGEKAEDRIRMVLGAFTPPQRSTRDQDNAIEAWPERGLLGTQLGPNKNGRKW